MTNIEKVSDYLKDAGVFYLTTMDGDKPKCRPISFYMVVDNTLYFGVGTFKDVYRQLTKNPNVEICAEKNNGFLRYYGKAVFADDMSLQEKAMDVMPMLRDIYNEETGNTLGIFSLESATAEFRGMLDIQEKIVF